MTELSDKIIQLHQSGKSYRQIAKELNCSKGTISYHLGSGQKQKTRERTKDKRDKIKRLLHQHKQKSGCVDCKEHYPYYMLEFDHCNGDKAFNISKYQFYTQDIEVVKEEIKKCEVVCANCHRIRTYQRSIRSGDNAMQIDRHYNPG